MPDDPTAPSLEMIQVPRQRMSMRARQEAVMDAFMAETRAEFAQIKADMESVRLQVQAQVERRTDDLRRLVSEVVKEEIAAQLEIKLGPVLEMLPALRVMVADHAKRATEEKEHEASMLRLIGVLRTLTAAMETGWQGVKPLLYALLGILLTSKAQSISVWPQSVFWVMAAFILVVSIAWPRLVKRLRAPLVTTIDRRTEKRDP